MRRLMSIRYGPGTQNSGGSADAHSRVERLVVSWAELVSRGKGSVSTNHNWVLVPSKIAIFGLYFAVCWLFFMEGNSW